MQRSFIADDNNCLAGAQPVTNGVFGTGSGVIVLDDVMCEGTEASIFDCGHPPLGVNDCAAAEAAGVVCQGLSVVWVCMLVSVLFHCSG